MASDLTDHSSADAFLRVAACSYEGSLFGWNMTENTEESSLDLQMKYAFSLNSGCMRSLAVSHSGRYMAVGGADERIKIFNMVDNKGLGELTQHTGGVTALAFFEDSILLSSSEDNTLCIWRVHDWQCLHILGGHKACVTHFSIHPTGKMALSVSKDGTMKLWNLVQGRCSFTRRLKKPAEGVFWASDGSQYMLQFEKQVQVYQAADNALVSSIESRTRINKTTFVNLTGEVSGASAHIALVCEDRSLRLYKATGELCGFVNLASLGGGRPRDLWASPPNVRGITNKDMRTILAESSGGSDIGGDCLVIATSLGAVYVFYAAAVVRHTAHTAAEGVEQVVLNFASVHSSKKDAVGESGETGDQELTVAQSLLLSSMQLSAEPRFTAVMAWKPFVASVGHSHSKRSHRKNVHDSLTNNLVGGQEDKASAASSSSVGSNGMNCGSSSGSSINKKTRKRDVVDAETDAAEETTVHGGDKKSKRQKKAVVFVEAIGDIDRETKSDSKKEQKKSKKKEGR